MAHKILQIFLNCFLIQQKLYIYTLISKQNKLFYNQFETEVCPIPFLRINIHQVYYYITDNT